ncbi:oligosaccharide repeat unit polymerase [Streptomyces sp. SPB162]|nr:oligosaccharide repeat unit polymerase [Streptomyces sp. SPB162]
MAVDVRMAGTRTGRRPEVPAVSPRAVLSRALAVPLVLGLVVFLPATVALQPGAGVRDEAYWLQIALTCYAGARLASMILTTRRRRLIQGSFWLFVYAAMGVASLAQLVLGRVPTPLVGPRSDLSAALALTLVGCVAFDVGVLLARHRPVRTGRKERPAASVSPRRLYLLVALAFVASGYYVMKLGGPAVLFSSRQEISDTLAETGVATAGSHAGSATLRGFGTVPALLALLFLTRWLVTSRIARRRPLPILLWIATAGLNLVVNNPISNARFWFLTVLFSILFTAFPRSPVMYRSALALGVVAALLVFPFMDRFRYDAADYKPMETNSVLEPLARKDYDQTVMFANAITEVHSGAGHTYGHQLAGAVFFYVPRSAWPDKALDTGIMLGEWMGNKNTNLSSPLWSELWLDFGPLGMTGGFLGIGYLAARGDRRYALRTADGGRPGDMTAIIVPLIAGYSFILLRGSLLQASGRIGIAVLCLALVTSFRTDPRKLLR